MKIKINTKIIAKLDPCSDRFANWKEHYSKFNGDIVEFLDLKYITHHDKLWVAMRLVPLDVLEPFAIDCAVSAQSCVHASAARAAAHAAYDAVDAAHAAYDAAADAAARAAADAAATAAAAAYDAAHAAYAAAHAAYAAYDAAYDVAYAAYAAATAASAASVAAADTAKQDEQCRQIEALIFLIQDER